MSKLFRAAWIAPMDMPPMRDGAVVVEGDRIMAVGPGDDLRSRFPDAKVEDMGPAVLLPGLVNAHTHLELSHCVAGESPEGSFADWILSLRAKMRLDPDDVAAGVTAALRAGVDQCLRFGVTCVGDISQQIPLSRQVLRETPLRVTSFGEALGLAGLRPRFEELLAKATDRSLQSERLRIGLTPHAPYTVDGPGYRQCLQIAREMGMPLATHLAETPEEGPFLENHAGAFRNLWEKLGQWREPVETFAGGPIAFAAAIGLLDDLTLLAHVNYCDDAELELLARGRASVVYCPRTHRYFGHPAHRWREMLNRGINVAIGTDSCASSPDLNLVDELRLLHEIAPDAAVEDLWATATVRGARALGWEDQIGTLTPGKQADLIAFAVRTDQPLREILENALLPTGVWIAGDRHVDFVAF